MGIGDVMRNLRELREERRDVIPLLVEHLHANEVKKVPGPKDYFGISRLGTWCPRSHVIAHRLDLPLVNEIDPKGFWRMDRGTGMHLVIQEMWLGPMGFLLGGWKCSRPGCAHLHGSMDQKVVTFDSAVAMPDACVACGEKNGKWTRFHFVEPVVQFDEGLWLRGQVDGLLQLPPHPMEVMDIKTSMNLDKGYFRDGKSTPSLREAPKQDHIVQLHWYMEAGRFKQGRLLYVNPQAEELHDALVEHVIPFDPALMFREKEKIRALREALEDETRPVPACPYGGVGPYGECPCVEVEVLWARSGPRHRASVHGDHDSQ